jgi:hypothetical protein
VSLIASSALCAFWLDPECVGGAALLSAKCVLSARAKLLRPRTLARPLSARAELRCFFIFSFFLKIIIFIFIKNWIGTDFDVEAEMREIYSEMLNCSEE